jgi:NIMA (never in mitosis gene a)-related kinase
MKRTVKLQKKLNEDQIMYWFLQLLLAMRDIHTQKILHRDIKTANVFISTGNQLKIGDFGISQPETKVMKGEMCGTLYYMAPEVINRKKYSYESDVWSLGCILYELCT